ncbi:discoidin domain-containing protein [Mariniflexile litorale]|uniref:Discoidin domain-containing protein n=1 Tax=Mariniflexile litorale TaxID=3045158 RepID=A0AAU7EFH8_9FLAO|nr:discoidin domain-containing protein [Mariniflexile sp. KMM 9835]MDQ8211449.1 discoidin domain-containing protein [Mariniflexile sp. KMM 9835]
MKKSTTQISILALFVIITTTIIFSLKTFQTNHSDASEAYSHDPEEHPEGNISPEEMLLNENYAKVASLKGNLKMNATTNASYADGLVTGSWSDVKFLTNDSSIYTGYGYRVDGSLYDKENDVLYVISYAGHLYRVDRDENNTSNTQWTLLDNKNNYNDDADDMYLYGINLPDGSFRMIRSRDNTFMEYSDDEGRSWTNSNVKYQWSSQDVGVAKTASGVDRIATFASIDNITRKPHFSTDGITYTASSLSFLRNDFTGHIVKPLKSENIYLFMHNGSTKNISIYKLGPNDADYQLVQSPNFVFTHFGNVMGTVINGVTHFTIAGNKHVYYSSDGGVNWTTKTTDSGNNAMRTMHPTQPNILFSGDTDIRMSRDFGVTHEGFSNRQGWDVQHQRMYEKADGSIFHVVGNDFGVFMSYTPEDKFSYIQLNNTAPTHMAYDAGHSENYNKSFTATQDRGARDFPLSATSTGSGEIRSTDAFRATVADDGASVWTWLYFGTLYHRDFAMPSPTTTDLNFTGSWWSAPLIASTVKNEDAVYVAAGAKLRKFTYNPSSKSIIKTDHYFDFGTETGSEITGLGFSPINPDLWYVSAKNGDFLYSEDGGQTFAHTTTNKDLLPKANTTVWGNWTKNQHVIKASAIDEKTVYYAGVGNKFSISTDGGQTFVDHSTGLNVFQIREFTLSPDEKFIYAAAGKAGPWVYSVDRDRWYSMVHAYTPTVDFTDVEYLVKTNTVVFSTYGSGVLKFKIDHEAPEILAPTNLNVINNDGDIELDWHDASNNETGFVLERSVEGEFIELAMLPANTTSYTDISFPDKSIARYRVKAINGSAESFYSNYVIIKYDSNEEAKKKWELVSVDSQELNKDGEAVQAFDNDANSMWHTQWFEANPLTTYPHELVIDMNETPLFSGFSYLPRQDGNLNGMIKDYEFYVSDDQSNWVLVAQGSWLATKDRKDVVFSNEISGRYLKLVALSEVNGNRHASCAEISIFSEIPAPAAPQFIQGGRLSNSEIQLRWLDLSQNEKGFKIEQLINGSYVSLAQTNSNITSYNLTNTDLNSWHRFRVTAFNDVGSASSKVLIIKGSGEDLLSMEGKLKKNDDEIVIFPNPFQDKVKFKINNNSKNYTNWFLFDSKGSLIEKGDVKEFEKEGISTKGLKSGIYFIKFKGKTENITRKIIKK